MKHNHLISKIFGLFFKKGSSDNNSSTTADDVLLAKDFLFDELNMRGMQPETDGSAIIFHYRGGHFRVQWLNRRIIRFVYPHIHSESLQAKHSVHFAVNSLNSSYMLVKSVAIADDSDKTLSIHLIADIYYTSENNSTPILENVLNQFFEMQHELIILIKEMKRRHPFYLTRPEPTLFSQN